MNTSTFQIKKMMKIVIILLMTVKIMIIHHAHFSWKKKQHLPTNFESDYTALQNSVNNNINEHAIISNLPLKSYLDYKNSHRMH